MIRIGTQKYVFLINDRSKVECKSYMCTRFVNVMHVLQPLGPKVKCPTLLVMDNKGAVYLANDWSVGGCARHIINKQ